MKSYTLDNTSHGVISRGNPNEVVGYFIVGKTMFKFTLTTSTTITSTIPTFVAKVTIQYNTKSDLTAKRSVDVKLGSKKVTLTFDNGPPVEGDVCSSEITEDHPFSGIAEWSELK